MKLQRNPYIAGIPVGNSANFVGRADILRETKRILDDPNQNAITLYGQRRIGKTSILQYLTQNLPQQGNYKTVLFDLEDKAAKPLGEVIDELASVIAKALKIPGARLGKNPEIAFRDDWLPKLLDSLRVAPNLEYSLVLLFDEFDVLADPQAGSAARDFFPYLRNLLSLDRQRLKFIFTLGRNVGDLSQVASSLFKGVPNKRVSLLSKSETTELIRLSEKNNVLRWSEGALERILDLTNGHPFLTQALCWEIWQDKIDDATAGFSKVDDSDVDKAIIPALEKSQNALDWLWQGLGPGEKVVAAALAQAGKRIVTQDDIENILNESGIIIIIRELSEEAPKKLKEWDLIEPVDGGYRFRVELLRVWIAEHFPLSLVQKELDEVQPAAEGLYQAARSLYQANKPEKAIQHLIDAIGYNPNHRGASEMLAEIYILRSELDKAQELLENLINVFPTIAKPRLIQVYLKQANKFSDNDQKLTWYQKVLDISPTQNIAQKAVQKIWRERGETALSANKLKEALDAFERANDSQMVIKITKQISDADAADKIKKIRQLESENKITEALSLFTELESTHDDVSEWNRTKARLTTKKELYETYQQAIGAISQNENQRAVQLLLKVINIQPDYENAAELLSRTISGIKREKTRSTLPENGGSQTAYLGDVPDLSLTDTTRGRKQSEDKQNSSLKELKDWNPFSYLVFLFWVLFSPNKRINYIEKFGNDTEIQSRWVTSFLLVLPIVYVQVGLIIGRFKSVIVDLYPITILAGMLITLVLWLLIGLVGSKTVKSWAFGLLGLFLMLALPFPPVSLPGLVWIWLLVFYLMEAGEALITKSEEYTETTYTYLPLISPLFLGISFVGWYVQTILLSGSFWGTVLGVVATIIALFVGFWVVMIFGMIAAFLINNDPLKRKRFNWRGVIFVVVHGILIWIIFLSQGII